MCGTDEAHLAFRISRIFDLLEIISSVNHDVLNSNLASVELQKKEF